MKISKVDLKFVGWTVGLVLMSSGLIHAQNRRVDDTGRYAGRYVCTAEASGGVVFNPATRHWRGAVFQPRSRFVMDVVATGFTEYPAYMPRENGTLYQIYIHEEGRRDRVREACVEPGGESYSSQTLSVEGIAFCNTFATHWRLNLSIGRFSYAYLVGYISGNDDGDDTAHIVIGSCRRIDN